MLLVFNAVMCYTFSLGLHDVVVLCFGVWVMGITWVFTFC